MSDPSLGLIFQSGFSFFRCGVLFYIPPFAGLCAATGDDYSPKRSSDETEAITITLTPAGSFPSSTVIP